MHGDPAVARTGDARAGGLAEPGQHLVHGALHGAAVVGLDVDRAEGRAGRARHDPLRERVERCGERQLDGDEPPALVDGPRGLVRREHLELEHLGAVRAQARGRLAQELGGDAVPARGAAHVEHVEEAELRTRLRRDRETEGLPVLLGEEHDPVAHTAFERGEVVVAVALPPRRVGDLGLELEPELADEREVVGGRWADHGTRCASRR